MYLRVMRTEKPALLKALAGFVHNTVVSSFILGALFFLLIISTTQIYAYWYVRGKHFDFWQGTILFSGNRVSWAPLLLGTKALRIFSDGLLVGPPRQASSYE